MTIAPSLLGLAILRAAVANAVGPASSRHGYGIMSLALGIASIVAACIPGGL